LGGNYLGTALNARLVDSALDSVNICNGGKNIAQMVAINRKSKNYAKIQRQFFIALFAGEKHLQRQKKLYLLNF
jgi:hypothetical protein